MSTTETIAAIATPAGRGGVGVIRISGSDTTQIATALLDGKIPSPRQAAHRRFHAKSGEILDDGIAVFFKAPHSFTGEDVLELQGHGGTVVLDRVLQACLAVGARLARPGEFSERAFLNDKLDLTQAEAIADLIDSSSEQAARSAIRGLQGEFSAAIEGLLEKMIHLRMYVEAALDFPEEEIDFLADRQVTNQLRTIQSLLTEIQNKARQGSLLREGMQVVIVGKPNAGKSSLLNALSGNETAIVTEHAGTTRDVLRETINLDGMPLHIVDTAGLRSSADPVEKIGIARAHEVMQQADLILHLCDDSESPNQSADEIAALIPELQAQTTELPRQIRVHNKIDLSGSQSGNQDNSLYISAKTGAGIDELKVALKTHMGFHSDEEGVFIARRRHLQALEKTEEAVTRAAEQLEVFNAGELMAEELRIAQEHLGEITGRFTSDDLLGSIFSSFCIGK